MEEKLKVIKNWYGGMVRDDKSRITGAASNLEEIDIFSNADYIQAEQIFSADSLPASTEVYAYTSNPSGTVYGYGKSTSNNAVRLVSVATGGADNPGSFATLATSSDTTNLATSVSPIQYFKTTEANNDSVYYIKGTGTSWYLVRYNIDAAEEQRWTGSAWSGSGSLDANTQLTGLTGSFDRPFMKVIAGVLHVGNGNSIATVDSEGTFTEKAFNLPLDYNAVDMAPVGTVALILASHADRSSNFCKGFWWDLVPVAESEYDGYDDSFEIPVGGPQWVLNTKERVYIFCAINGKGRFFVLNGAYQGSVPQELPGVILTSVAAESATQPISSSKMVSTKDKIIYFGVNKTDKTGVYALGQLDDDKPHALLLSKKFSTTTITNHKPTALFILGPNYYAAYVDNTTASTARCESNNSPSRSASAIYESIWVDDDAPNTDKKLYSVYVSTQPLPASTDVNVSIALDYGSYNEIFRADGTSLNTTSAVQGEFKAKRALQNKVFKVKLELVSATTSSPKVTSIGLKMAAPKVPAPN